MIGETPLKTFVELTDTDYFCNKSWTISYNVNTQAWVSFHTYIPNFYIGENNFFYSGLNESCDLEAIAAEIVYCNLEGEARLYITTTTTTTRRATTTTTSTTVFHTTTTTTTLDCSLEGTAVYQS